MEEHVHQTPAQVAALINCPICQETSTVSVSHTIQAVHCAHCGAHFRGHLMSAHWFRVVEVDESRT